MSGSRGLLAGVLALLFAISSVAPRAGATVSSGPAVLLDSLSALVEGRGGVLRLSLHGGVGSLRGIEVLRDGVPCAVRGASEASLGSTVPLDFEVPGGSPVSEVIVRGTLEGRPFAQRFDLHATGIARALAQASDPRRDLQLQAPRPASATAATASTIRVHGSLGVLRPDGRVVPAEGAYLRVFEASPPRARVLLAGYGYTDSTGAFDFTVAWTEPYVPQLAVAAFAHASDSMVVLAPDGGEIAFLTPYRAVPGSDLSLSSLTILERSGPAFYLLTLLEEIRRWSTRLGFRPPAVKTYLGMPSTYEQNGFGIAVADDDRWSEWVIAHEYAHHWSATFNPGASVDTYANGVCDGAGGNEDGHCIWCAETARVAWLEGFADYFADRFTEQKTGYAALPLTGDLPTGGLEAIQECVEPGGASSPGSKIEGRVGAVLYDLADSAPDVTPVVPVGGDRIAYGDAAILQFVNTTNPSTIWTFMHAEVAAHPADAHDLWLTAINDSLDFDEAPPAVPGTLTCTDHTAAPSTDATLNMTWTRPDDDGSGVVAYAYAVGLGAPPAVPTTANLGDVTSWASQPLSPGNWYFGIRAVDGTGHWGPTATAGPFGIGPLGAPDLQPYTPDGWAGSFVPRATADAGESNVIAPTAPLPAAPAAIYVNFAWANFAAASSPAPRVNLIVNDPGDYNGSLFYSGAALPALTYSDVINVPLTGLAGQRGTMGIYVDGIGAIAESNETDNTYARQWVIQPLNLTGAGLVRRSRPMLALASRPDLPAGAPPYPNVAGFTFTPSTRFNAVTLRSKRGADYDLRLYPPSTSADSGLGIPVAASERVGDLDAIFVDRDQPGNNHPWDVGVLRYVNAAVDDSLYVEHVPSQTIAWNAPTAVAFGQDESLRLIEVPVPAGDLDVAYQVQVGGATPATTPVRIARVEDFRGPILPLASLPNQAASGADGLARIVEHRSTNAVFTECLAVYREAWFGTGPLTVTVTVRPATAAVAAQAPPGWYSPLVPRPAADGSDLSVPSPAILQGDAAGTWLNFAVANASEFSPLAPPRIETAAAAATAAAFDVVVHLDGVRLTSAASNPLATGPYQFFHPAVPYAVRGGRHTLTFAADSAHVLTGSNATNDIYGQSWVWTPATLAPGSVTTRTAPPDPAGGFAELRAEPYGFADCDGLRLPAPVFAGQNGRWQAFAAVPGAASALRLDAFEASTGATSGFDTTRATCLKPVGETGYLLGDFITATPRAFDVGIQNAGGGENFTAETAASTFLATHPAGSYGPFAIAAGHAIAVHDVQLPAGVTRVTLVPGTGAVDWGLAIHPADSTFQSPASIAENMTSWLAPAGQPEVASAVVPAAGRYALVVWKHGASDLATPGSYSLAFAATALPAPPPELPAASGLRRVSPNPTADRLTIEFDVARSGGAVLEVYDVHGARVASLVRGALAVGHHVRTWNGRTAEGAVAKSGVYFVRLVTPEGTSARRIVRL